jgi:hypothetical protein
MFSDDPDRVRLAQLGFRLRERFLYEWANDHCRRRSIALEDKRHFPMPDPFETYLGKAREFVAGEIAFEVATTGGGYY